MTVASVVVVALAVVSVLMIAGIQCGSITISSPLRASIAKSASIYALGPHLLVIALFATGYWRSEDVAAIAAACWICGWAGVISMLTFDSAIATVAVLQVVMLSTALNDLWSNRHDDEAMRHVRARKSSVTERSTRGSFPPHGPPERTNARSGDTATRRMETLQ